MASDSCIMNARYKYIHDDHKNPIEAIDAHHVLVRTINSRVFFACLFALLVTETAFSLSLLKDESILILLWSLLLSALLVKLFLRKPVEKESIIIMPAFGVQLETQNGRGRKVRRFIPIDKILKPVLNECVTPVTCYWSLSLISTRGRGTYLSFQGNMPTGENVNPDLEGIVCSHQQPGES